MAKSRLVQEARCYRTHARKKDDFVATLGETARALESYLPGAPVHEAEIRHHDNRHDGGLGVLTRTTGSVQTSRCAPTGSLFNVQ